MISEGRKRRGHENPGDMWDKRAEEFNRSTRGRNERTDRQVASLKLDPDYTVLDVGAGTGRLSVPIAKIVKQVTAVDQSRGMLSYLEENMAEEGLSNYKAIQKRWEDVELGVDLEPHDVVIASHSLGMFDLQEALAKMDAAAKKRVYIFTAAGKWFFDGFEEELWERVYDRPPRRGGGLRSDYMLLYNILHDMGIYANVEIRDAEHVQRYGSLDEAVERWKARREISEENEPLLREYLAKNLTEDGDNGGGLTFRRRTKSAMIWWPKSESS
ncbi:MAG TPA: class I SAM-dependent methyltransferase [Methanothrix sp.]|nr:class I SAM-dependent methyltransferase [Methanothrix sp.]HPR67142.1 class I SAM-dependent methyltransferase [Methanothrix sp.]